MKQSTATKISIALGLLLLVSSVASAGNERDESHRSYDNLSHSNGDVNQKHQNENRSVSSSPEDIVENYFVALQSGDTVEIRNLLGGELLRKKKRLLSNPTYPYTLQDWYRGASFSISGTYIVDANKVNVEAIVSRSNTKQVKYSFLLEPDSNGVFRITSETEVL